MADAQLPDPAGDIKDVLFRTNDEYKQLVTEHHNLDERIRHFSTYSYLTDQQQYEQISLKKQKLALKDRIEAIVRGEPDTRH